MYYDWKEKTNTEELRVVCNLIRNGEIVIFPTETVYGIGANALDASAVGKIFVAKGRPSDNPLIVHLADKRKIKDIAEDVTEVEQKLIDNFMPGPFTLILKRKPIIPDIVTGGLNTVGIRIPENIIARGIITYSGVPIAAPSANISGKPSGTNIEDIRKELEGKVTPEDIDKVIGNVKIDKNIFRKINMNETIESPGMKYRHYAPETSCKLVYCEDELDQIFYLKKYIKEYKGDVVVIGFDEHKDKLFLEDKRFISIGKKDDLDGFARNIFSNLREADKMKPYKILIEGVKKEGLGYAIMNRLIRTCEHDMFIL